MRKKIYHLLLGIAFVSCNKNSEQNVQEYENNKVNAISSYSANSSFQNISSIDKISKEQIDYRTKNCPITHSNLTSELGTLIKDFKQENLLRVENRNTIPIFKILEQTSALVSDKPSNITSIHGCYFPEIYLTNALMMNVLQQIPFSPFNQENLNITNDSADDSFEQTNWRDLEQLKNSRFAKLNGLIRSATIARKVTTVEKATLNSANKLKAKVDGADIYLFDTGEIQQKETYYANTLTLANSLLAIGYYERAHFRWDGSFSANELNMPVNMPNENLQNIIDKIYLGNLSSKNNLVPLKYVIAYDLLMANKYANEATEVDYKNTSFCDGKNISTHLIPVCSEAKKIQTKAYDVDLKRLICTSGKEIETPITKEDYLNNYFWEEAVCVDYLETNPSLKNMHLKANGESYHSLNYGYLNPLKLDEKVNSFQKTFQIIKQRLDQIRFIEKIDFGNKQVELANAVVNLKAEKELLLKQQNKVREEITLAEFNKKTSEIIAESYKEEKKNLEIEQSNLFRNYVTQHSSLKSLEKLKGILDRYENDKATAINNYKIEYCGSTDVNACNGGRYGLQNRLINERMITVKNDWKNECLRDAQTLSNIYRQIGKSGCDIKKILPNLNGNNEREINAALLNALKNNPEITATCQTAVISEAQSQIKNKELQDFLNSFKPGQTCEDIYRWERTDCSNKDRGYCDASMRRVKDKTICRDNIDKFKDLIAKLGLDSTKLNQNNSSESVQSYLSSIRTNSTFSENILKMHSDKINYEKVLEINEANKDLLIQSQNGFCSNRLSDMENGSRPQFDKMLQVRSEFEQLQMQRLQITKSINDDQIEFDRVVNEKRVQLADQIQSLQQTNKNLAKQLGLNQSFELLVASKAQELMLSEFAFGNFYSNNLNAFYYYPIKSIDLKIKSQETQNLAAKTNVIISQQNLEINKKQIENIDVSILQTEQKVKSHDLTKYLITSLKVNTNSFQNELEYLKDLNELSKQMVFVASNRLLQMNPNYTLDFNVLYDLSKVKVFCSYLASFEDGLVCLNYLKSLKENFDFRTEKKFAKIKKGMTFKIYSSDLRKTKDDEDDEVTELQQHKDNLLLNELNETGIMLVNIDEQFLIDKGFFPRKFVDEYYRARILGMTVNIIQKNLKNKKYIDMPFDETESIAYVLHDGLNAEKSADLFQCNSNYSAFSQKMYDRFMHVLNNNPNKLKNYSRSMKYLFSAEQLQNIMCTNVFAIHAKGITKENSQLKYVNVNNELTPISLFNKDKDINSQSKSILKVASFDWIENIKDDPTSSPAPSEVFWQPLTGHMTDTLTQNFQIGNLTRQIYECINSSSLDTSNCTIANNTVYKSFAGFPLLGKYTFVYAPHEKDKIKNLKRTLEKQTSIEGIEIDIIYSE
ncbi:hypothetical protein GCL60_12485 [Silvanigrella paludirubra]|uniref:Uncharacterized protein n=1 Tax=Silvanigrella paludirubra TaxID=2499159 RepID=A0A6N6VRI4_9BACT|nr:hypothetical protein [Silvanigrella paludirubra]KAB8037982.1 hypothetical protein GCL60_12485 [Silvanigrella paludirubra]